MHNQLLSSHGLLAIVDVLEASPSREVITKLLRIVNIVSPWQPTIKLVSNLTHSLACHCRRRNSGKLLSYRVSPSLSKRLVVQLTR